MCTVFALVLVAVLYERSRPPPPKAPPPPIPRPSQLSPGEQADYAQAADATKVVVGAALLTRVWRWDGPTEVWPDASEALASKALVPQALVTCGWEGRLRALDCRTPPCVARFDGPTPGACEAWPAAIEQSWVPYPLPEDTGTTEQP